MMIMKITIRIVWDEFEWQNKLGLMKMRICNSSHLLNKIYYEESTEAIVFRVDAKREKLGPRK